MTIASPANNQSPSTELRNASPSELARCLRTLLGLDPDEPARTLLGLDPDEPAPGELAASVGRPLPAEVEGLDAAAWIAWCLAGLPLFAGRFPTLRRVKATASRVVMALAMTHSDGNLTRVSTALGVSRQTLRESLRFFDLYPWRPMPVGEQ